MRDQRLLSYFWEWNLSPLVMEFSYIKKRYAIEILKIFQMLDCNFVQTPVDYGMYEVREGRKWQCSRCSLV